MSQLGWAHFSPSTARITAVVIHIENHSVGKVVCAMTQVCVTRWCVYYNDQAICSTYLNTHVVSTSGTNITRVASCRIRRVQYSGFHSLLHLHILQNPNIVHPAWNFDFCEQFLSLRYPLLNKWTPNVKGRHWATTSHPHNFYSYCLSILLSPSVGGYRKNVPTKIRYAFVTPVYELHVRVVLGFIPSWVLPPSLFRIVFSESFHLTYQFRIMNFVCFFHQFSSSPSSPCNAVVTRWSCWCHRWWFQTLDLG